MPGSQKCDGSQPPTLGYDATVMAVEPDASTAARGARRWRATVVSVLVHAGAIALAVEFAPRRVPPATAQLDPIAVEIVMPPPSPEAPPPSGAGQLVPAQPAGDAGARSRHGRGAPKHVQPRAEPASGFSDLSVHYEAPSSPDPGSETSHGEGLGLGTAGAGTGEIGVGGLNVPPAPSPAHSLRRHPRPKLPYEKWSFAAPPQFNGSHVLLDLMIDPRGSVQKISVIRSVDPEIDRRARDTARRFEFHPALDDDGAPVWGQVRWDFGIGIKS